MDYFDNFLNQKKNLILLGVLTTLSLVIFYFLFGFHTNNDTDGFIYMIRFFRGEQDVVFFPNRYLNPFYPILGMSIFSGFSPEVSIILSNIIFFIGMVFLTYGLLRRIFGNKIALASSIVIMTSYPILRYGLTQVQDMGGYFWYVLTLYVGWRWWESKKFEWLLVGSIAVSLGILTKESGAMGAIFIGFIVLFSALTFKNKIKNLIVFSLAPFVTILINSWRGGEIDYNSGQWFMDNWRIYAPTNYNFIKWAGVNISTYNLLWPFILLGIYFLIKKRLVLSRDIKIYLLAVLLPSLSYFSWPIFISRTVFISAWFFVPIAIYGLAVLYENGRVGKYVAIIFYCLILIAPYALQNILRYAHLFTILEQCRYNLRCGWDLFWRERESASKFY